MKRDHIYLFVLIVIVSLWLIDRCGLKKSAKEDKQAITNSAAALLQDTLEKVTSKKDTFWRTVVAELTPEQILETDIGKQLRYDQQLLLAELAKAKKLVASMQMTFTGNKVDTVTQYIRIPVYHAFTLAWMDTVGGFTYTDTVYVDSNMTRRVFTPRLRFTPDVRLTKEKKGIIGEVRMTGLEEFNLQGEYLYSFYTPNSPADIRRGKWKKVGRIAGYVGSNALSFWLGTRVN